MSHGTRRTIGTALASLVLAGVLAACGSSSKGSSATTAAGGTAPASSGKVLTIGYSAWPGWFPLAVADQTKQFEKAGLNVKLVYFADYTASLDALVAGKIDVNAQTLNDTLFGVAAGSKQKVVVVNDNSTGNDAIICDKSITSIADLKGKTIAAEAGVVDQFLLLQGLATKGLTDKDISFKGVKTDAAAAGFAGGQFDCAAVFAPFTVQALKRPGSHVVFSSKQFPGVIPDHLVATEAAYKDRPGDMQKLVDAWYATLAAIKADPAGTTAIMAKKAGLSVTEYDSLAAGTTIFSPAKALDAFQDRKGDPTSLPEMARRINPFLVSAGLTKNEAPLDGLFAPEFTSAYVKAHKAGA
ncbi:MAG: Aliphatic sulfonates transporter substrate-binding protein [Acidimicrobiales bacterium]|nr:Aliphatic sulfonates transporter substrate-binding protein [Acidimicrobiales bacterium]